MSSLKTKRGLVKSALTRVISYVNSDAEIGLQDLECRLTRLNEIWEEYKVIMDAMVEACEDEAEIQEIDADFAEFEGRALQVICRVKEKIEVKKQETAAPAASSSVNLQAGHSSVTLPAVESGVRLGLKLQIKPFNGEVKDWKTFHDAYVTSIHNNTGLSQCQKFQLLKGYLEGRAYEVIGRIPETNENYSEAWQRLCQRYDRAGVIANSYITQFLEIPTLNVQSMVGLRNLYDSADEVLRNLKALGELAEKRDVWLIHILFEKLDNVSKQEWVKFNKSNVNFPSIQEFLEFVDKGCSALEASSTEDFKDSNDRVIVKRNDVFSRLQLRCKRCQKSHELADCVAFAKMDVKERREFVWKNKLCFICLKEGHRVNNCSSKGCAKCKGRHHALLHEEFNNGRGTVKVNFNLLQDAKALLPTAVCYAIDHNGEQILCRLLLDSGSETTLISEEFVKRLGLRRMRAEVVVQTVNGQNAGNTNSCVKIRLESRISSEFCNVVALVIPSISSNIPSTILNENQFESIFSLKLADPLFYISSPVDMLLGSDKFFEIVKGEKVSISQSSFYLVNTSFGWIVGGTVNVNNHETRLSNFCCNVEIDKELKKFWEVEEVPAAQYTEEEKRTEEHFLKTYIRKEDGSFSVALPFKDEYIDFGRTYEHALQRFYRTERRLSRDIELKQQYVKFMNEYLNLDHMERIPTEEIKCSTDKCYYFPHHPVFKSESTTTKMRVVFDGSAHSQGCPSLNNNLHTGPSLLKNIFSILVRFRMYRFIMSGDIEKMYRMIWVHESDRNFQRILWRESESEPVGHYRLKTVTYGTSCAPFIAVRVLHELAESCRETHPLASKIILKDFYMDDVLTGAETVEEVLAIHKELVDALRTAGMNLRKWCSNCEELLSSLPEHMREMSSIKFEPSKRIKLLGLIWNPTRDVFQFNVSPESSKLITKRSILSEAARIYDPLGFLTPFTVLIKIFFQKMWLLQLDWKDEVPYETKKRWDEIKESMSKINELEIPRQCIFSNGELELFGFCDASEDAYAAAVYCRAVVDGTIVTRLVAAKSRVAPIKQISLPRLELCGAVLLCRLMNNIVDAIDYNKERVHLYTDSAIVLHWLSSFPRRWSVFIANRTSEILSDYSRKQWHHVQSKQNPADPASRGILALKLQSLTLWWHGPEWLQQGKESWNDEAEEMIVEGDLEERKVKPTVTICHIVLDSTTNDTLNKLIQNISGWVKVIRVLAYCLRMVRRFKKRSFGSFLSTEEMEEARVLLIKFMQWDCFAKEIGDLQMGKPLNRKNKLASLSPFLHEGVLRVGGRLENSTLPFDAKHPIILSSRHGGAKLLVRQLHLQYLHVGASQLFCLLRQRYWITGARGLIKEVVHNCVTCFKQRKLTEQQLMGNLPAERVNVVESKNGAQCKQNNVLLRAFTKVGCDYAGPFTLKVQAGKRSYHKKGYIALFVCFVTKAIHLELVENLATESFIGALDRFIARRGIPAEVWTDNANNFVGAKRKLEEIHRIVRTQQREGKVAEFFANTGIQWKFIPPSAPHFGGLWEISIKSVKTHLKRVIGDSALTFECFYTLLTKIEALLNSRPLCSFGSEELDVLTPAHFLIGQPYTMRPEPIINETQLITSAKHWVKVRNMVQGFWNRWRKEYLTSLQQRQKWRVKKPNLEVNDIVIVHEPRIFQSQWRLGRVMKIHPGKDNIVRVVTIRTASGEYKRPITKLSRLPLAEEINFSGGREYV